MVLNTQVSSDVHLQRSRTREIAQRGWPVVVTLVGVGVAAVWHPGDSDAATCPLRAATGIWCPGCGMTRGLLAIGRADWSDAWRYHPWAWALAAQFVVFMVMRVRQPARTVVVSPKRTQRFLIGNIGALFAIWVIRYATGAIPFA
jgi:hypothetical protein